MSKRLGIISNFAAGSVIIIMGISLSLSHNHIAAVIITALIACICIASYTFVMSDNMSTLATTSTCVTAACIFVAAGQYPISTKSIYVALTIITTFLFLGFIFYSKSGGRFSTWSQLGVAMISIASLTALIGFLAISVSYAGDDSEIYAKYLGSAFFVIATIVFVVLTLKRLPSR